MTKRRIRKLRDRHREARRARKAGLPGENPKKLLDAIRAHGYLEEEVTP